MFDCFKYEDVSLEEVKKHWCLKPKTEEAITHIISYTDTPCFAMDQLKFIGIKKFTTGEIFVSASSGILR